MTEISLSLVIRQITIKPEEFIADTQFSDRELRSYEIPTLVHSTPKENYPLILKDGYLKSWNLLKLENLDFEDKPIGSLLGDPKDLSDYIILGSGINNEIVVLSKQNKSLCMDIEAEYIPGARFYFSTKQLASEGLLVRDGLHYKVKNRLSLSLSFFCATAENLNIDKSNITPKIFATAADKAFNERVEMTKNAR